MSRWKHKALDGERCMLCILTDLDEGFVFIDMYGNRSVICSLCYHEKVESGVQGDFPPMPIPTTTPSYKVPAEMAKPFVDLLVNEYPQLRERIGAPKPTGEIVTMFCIACGNEIPPPTGLTVEQIRAVLMTGKCVGCLE